MSAKTCQQCGGPMAGETAEGLCARCLISVALKEPTVIAGGSGDVRPAPSPEEIGVHFPQLEILELLGRGGMGVVYKARQRELDRLVALKILPPEFGKDVQFVERFKREARALAKLNHPNIVSVHEFGQTATGGTDGAGLCYFLMEFVEGANLRTLIQSKSIAASEALAIVPKICEALQFAHEEGVTHRDIKPENILLDKRGRVKIADFGLAKILGVETNDFTLTQTGMSLGTPRYMAPEQIEKPETVDHRADIYSLGVVFYEMLTGEVPMGRFAPPSAKVAVDVKLDEIVLRSLERDVERRYQHASEVKQDVERVVSQSQAPRGATPSPAAPASVETNDADESENTNFFTVQMPLFLFAMLVSNFVADLAKKWGGNEWSSGFHLVAIFLLTLGIVYRGSLAIYRRVVAGWSGIGVKEPTSVRSEVPVPAAVPPSASKPPARHFLCALLGVISIFAFFFAFSFQAKTAWTAAGQAKLMTVGALDPLYVSDSGPSGFNTSFNFFSWSFFAAVLAGVAFGALWRIGREDQGKVPRDPVWWRAWWKGVGVWGGVLLVVCLIRTVMNPDQVLRSPHQRLLESTPTPKQDQPLK